MNGLAGMEKFSHLEDKIYLTIEFAKKIREENEKIETEMTDLRDQISDLKAQNAEMEKRIEGLMSERDAIQLKIEAMLDAITVIEPEVGEVFQGR